MARRTVVELTDDLDGSQAEETVTFSLDGTDMEIDLSKAHAKDLRNALEHYVKAARKADSGRRGWRGRGPRVARGPEMVKAIREWAREQGMTVSERGRIPGDVEKKYHAAHGSNM